MRARWQRALVGRVRRETASARTLHLDVRDWPGHRAGQRLDLRLTAEDGYQATRSYSLSSGAGEGPQITVERVDDGEVSPYLVDHARVGDVLEVRGPVGGHFVWDAATEPGPVLLVAGGSGVAPLRAIWRTALPAGTPVRLVYSARTRDRVIFADELCGPGAPVTTVHLTRETAPGHVHGRVGRRHLAGLVDGLARAYACGPTAFVEHVAGVLVGAGLDPARLRTQRFG